MGQPCLLGGVALPDRHRVVLQRLPINREAKRRSCLIKPVAASKVIARNLLPGEFLHHAPDAVVGSVSAANRQLNEADRAVLSFEPEQRYACPGAWFLNGLR